jgi:predicted Zn-dependent protease
MSPLRRRFLPLVLALAMAWPLGLLRAQGSPSQLPSLGESASDDFDVTTERRLGQQIMREVWQDPEYLDDPVLQEYLQSIWSPLVSASRRLGNITPDIDAAFDFDIFLVRARSVNAFALPGGHMGVHLGLIAMTERSEELASVLAHELSHVTQRHIARRIGDASRGSMIGLAAMILGLLAASRAGSPDAAQAAIVGGQAAMLQGQLNFSRDMEREADRVGFNVLDTSGFNAWGMASMFEKLSLTGRLNDDGAFPYLRTHPLTTERIAEARDRVSGRPNDTSLPGVHALMRARARVLMDESAAELQRLEPNAVPEQASASERLAGLYTQALASSKLNDTTQALRAADAALQLSAGPEFDLATRRAAARLAAEVRLKAGQPERARQALDVAEASAGRPGLLMQAQLALADAQRGQGGTRLRPSAEALQVWCADHPRDAAAWNALAQVADAAGLPLRAQRARAEASWAVGDLEGAITRMRVSQRDAAPGGGAEPIELQVIDARLRDWQRVVREERESARKGR